jgi:hypothetical protein
MNTALKIQAHPLSRNEIYQLLRSVIIGEQPYTTFYSPTLGQVIGIYRHAIPATGNPHITWFSVEEMKLALRMTKEELKRYHYFKQELIG